MSLAFAQLAAMAPIITNGFLVGEAVVGPAAFMLGTESASMYVFSIDEREDQPPRRLLLAFGLVGAAGRLLECCVA